MSEILLYYIKFLKAFQNKFKLSVNDKNQLE